MRKKWNPETIKELIEKVNNFQGKKTEYIRTLGMHPSQYYKLLKKNRSSQNNLTASNKVVRLITSKHQGTGFEIIFPAGHKLNINSEISEAALFNIIKYVDSL
jgi:hypothetical protein